MKNKILASVVSLVLVAGLSGPVFAQTTATSTATSPAVTSQDLIGGDPGLLPTSPLYFLKNWGWAIQRFFTFNPVAKAELDLHITNVKAAEIAKLQEEASNNAAAVAKALENYQNSVARLQTQLQSLTQTSQNPNVNTLLQKLADRAVKHEALFRELEDKFSTSTDIHGLVRDNIDKIDETLKEADSKDDSGNFGETLSEALTDASSSIYGEKAVEVLSHLQDVLPEKAQEMLKHVREKIQERIQERLQEASSSEAENENPESSSSLDVEFENNLNDLNECGPMPTSTGNWKCDEGDWKLPENGNEEAKHASEQIQEQAQKQSEQLKESVQQQGESQKHLEEQLRQKQNEGD